MTSPTPVTQSPRVIDIGDKGHLWFSLAREAAAFRVTCQPEGAVTFEATADLNTKPSRRCGRRGTNETSLLLPIVSHQGGLASVRCEFLFKGEVVAVIDQPIEAFQFADRTHFAAPAPDAEPIDTFPAPLAILAEGARPLTERFGKLEVTIYPNGHHGDIVPREVYGRSLALDGEPLAAFTRLSNAWAVSVAPCWHLRMAIEPWDLTSPPSQPLTGLGTLRDVIAVIGATAGMPGDGKITLGLRLRGYRTEATVHRPASPEESHTGNLIVHPGRRLNAVIENWVRANADALRGVEEIGLAHELRNNPRDTAHWRAAVAGPLGRLGLDWSVLDECLTR